MKRSALLLEGLEYQDGVTPAMKEFLENMHAAHNELARMFSEYAESQQPTIDLTVIGEQHAA